MRAFVVKYGRWLAILMVGLYVVLLATGLLLQRMTGSFTNEPLFVYFSAAANLAQILVGALLIWRLPLHPVGWLFSSIALLEAMDSFAFGYAAYGLEANPGSLPAVGLVAIWLNWTGRALAATFLALLFLLFPTGRPFSRRWRYVAWLAIAAGLVFVLASVIAPNPAIALPFARGIVTVGQPARAILEAIAAGANLLAVFCIVAAIVSLFVRLRRSQGVERQQLKWFVYAAATFLPGLALLILRFYVLPGGGPSWLLPLNHVLLSLYLIALPVASAIAILRYRLYDIDIIIQRTLVYGLLTAALASVYFIAVVSLQQILQALTGQQSPLAIVVSTLLIAALFSPLRRRIQNFIDRRFYRRKYNAARTLAVFAATARDEVDLERLTAELLRVVQDTMQPAGLSLRLKEQ